MNCLMFFPKRHEKMARWSRNRRLGMESWKRWTSCCFVQDQFQQVFRRNVKWLSQCTTALIQVRVINNTTCLIILLLHTAQGSSKYRSVLRRNYVTWTVSWLWCQYIDIGIFERLRTSLSRSVISALVDKITLIKHFLSILVLPHIATHIATHIAESL